VTVFIICQPKPGPQGNMYDVSPAQEYGPIEYIFEAYQNPSANPTRSLKRVRDILEKFNPDKDYIVTAGGDPYSALLVGYVISKMKLPLKYLRFERLRTRAEGSPPGQPNIIKSGYYIPVELPLSAYEDQQ